ncbi:uncharacterized protein LOC101890465 [Musca domestica]|uniref:Uncharacterized protein LOC101890465 n=1 Tax=Musca domestica TaxID=7370 RepID=A0A1I8MZA9_MUSDO|nr:uncharacterized protein LOC101890465 [Musca domestica]
MSLSAYTFQFYSYNMPSYRPGAIIHNDSMDVDDIDLSHPPPKPPRMAALQNQLANNNGSSSNNSNINSQQPAMTSTPKSVETMKTATGQTLEPSMPAPLNYFRDVNETPKSIYSSGLGAVVGATTTLPPVSGEMQLQSRRNIPPKRWSHELRAKALEMSKHSSGSADNTSSDSEGDGEVAEGGRQQIKPQTMVGHKSWSCQIKEKALEMSKRNSVRFEEANKEEQAGVNTNNYQQTSHLSEIKTNNQSNVTFGNTSISSSNGCGGVGGSNDNSFGSFGNLSLTSSSHNFSMGNENPSSQDTLRSVKERISYFNTLTTVGNNTFINLLKNSKTQARATLNNTSTQSLNIHFATPAKPKRWSTHINLHLEQPTPAPEALTAKPSRWQSNASSLSTSSASSSSTASSSFSLFCPQTPATVASSQQLSVASAAATFSFQDTTTATSSPSFASFSGLAANCSAAPLTSSTPIYNTSSIQRKNSLRRKPSIEKSRRPIQRQNSTAGTNGGTKPQMHAVMEDLSLVMPVKLRVAEYERRIMMES